MLLAFMLCCIAAAQKKDIPVNAPAIGYKWYPRYVTFLPYHQLDSVLAYAETDIVPVIYSVNKYELIPNAQTDSIADLLDRIIIDPRIKYNHKNEMRLISKRNVIMCKKTKCDKKNALAV